MYNVMVRFSYCVCCVCIIFRAYLADAVCLRCCVCSRPVLVLLHVQPMRGHTAYTRKSMFHSILSGCCLQHHSIETTFFRIAGVALKPQPHRCDDMLGVSVNKWRMRNGGFEANFGTWPHSGATISQSRKGFTQIHRP